MKNYDIIIVGAGTAGSIASRFAAEAGYKVCLLDGKPKSKIGDKICGDAVGTEIFDWLKIPHPKGEELVNNIKGVLLFSPDLLSNIIIKDPKYAGYIIDRFNFGQRLLDEALTSGEVDLYDSSHVTEPIISNNAITGVKVKGKSFNGIEEIHGDLVIDASGFHSVLKKFIDFPHFENKVGNKDMIYCYREILEFKHEAVVENSDYITIILDQKRAPGGYIWYFPRNDKSLNMGLGVNFLHKENLKHIYQKEVFEKFVRKLPHKIISSGGGVVSVCKPLYTCVANGIIFAGDSANQVNPLHGGGIDPSMRAGFYAIEAYKHAVKLGSFDAISLWRYNELIQRNMGASYASLDLLRIALQGLTNEDLNYGLRKGLLSGSEVLQIAADGELSMDIFGMVSKIVKGFSNPRLLLDLYYLNTKMNEIKQIYYSYPKNPREMDYWVEKVEEVYELIINRFKK